MRTTPFHAEEALLMLNDRWQREQRTKSNGSEAGGDGDMIGEEAQLPSASAEGQHVSWTTWP